LQKSALVKNEYVKKENADKNYSFYDITEFGEGIINNLMNTIRVPQSSSFSIQTLDIKSTASPTAKMPLKSKSTDCKFTIGGASASESNYKISLERFNNTMQSETISNC
jgi:hypothetical protein